MSPSKLPGGPTQDEVMAVALFKLGLRDGDCMVDVGAEPARSRSLQPAWV